ncbi:MAG: hypothetical protein ACK44W_01190, partial [Planctomycetota bacterium]
MAADLGVYVGAVGQLQTTYVLTSALAGPPLAFLAGRFERRGLLLTALGARAAGGPFPTFARDVGVCTLTGMAGLIIALGYAMACGFAFRHPRAAMMAAVGPIFFWELLVTWWPMKFAAYTVTNNVRALLKTLLFEGRPGRIFKYVRNFELPEYSEAALFVSALAGLALAAAMVAAMNRSIEGREAR